MARHGYQPPTGEVAHLLVELSDEQESNRGGTAGAAREGVVQAIEFGYGQPRNVAAFALQSDEELSSLLESWERLEGWD